MRVIAGLLLFFAQPFWESKPPEKWTDREIDTLVHASPWGQIAGPSPEVLVYLATAAPIEEAEAQQRLRIKRPLAEPDPDYANYLRLNRDHAMVLAIPYAEPIRFGTEEEQKRLEEDCELVIVKKAYKILGYFPPTPADPVLRLVFPRAVKTGDRSAIFRLYLPGIAFPEREVEFRVKELVYRGKLEM